MIVLMTSPSAVGDNGRVDQNIANVLIQTKAQGNPVGLISNHEEPEWFGGIFENKGVQFIQEIGRQNGGIVTTNAATHKLNPFDVLVLAGSSVDLQMGKNGGAVVIAAGWSTNKQVKTLGIKVDNAQELQEVINLTSAWKGNWWFTGQRGSYSISALADLSTYGKGYTQEQFAKSLTATVKNGGSKLNALLTTSARSLLMDGAAKQDQLVWGVYPSSNSQNDDTEILSDFTHRLRTTVSRVRYAAKNEPLFIRHTQSAKRSAGGGGDRTDPTEQIKTVHLNSFYRGKLNGRNAIVIDDCTTYGVSFGVAAALLKKAGAASVRGVALGKFGNQLRHYDIEIEDDPFSPVTNFTHSAPTSFHGTTNNIAQESLRDLI